MSVQASPHYSRIAECVDCGGPTERRTRRAGTFPPVDYDWCARCRMAMWCACEACEVLRVLAE